MDWLGDVVVEEKKFNEIEMLLFSPVARQARRNQQRGSVERLVLAGASLMHNVGKINSDTVVASFAQWKDHPSGLCLLRLHHESQFDSTALLCYQLVETNASQERRLRTQERVDARDETWRKDDQAKYTSFFDVGQDSCVTARFIASYE
ncbi:hypothetical protein Slin15195_G110390 [Septoria linicola]|uniref:Uncharacterized protein n=1 Tax=Septoria linicola TaxID=215465 RepID=A0A9Q9EP43_9PEZI|nr:hypothetical protein Slin15195_G110390 [Septoria linicola]